MLAIAGEGLKCPSRSQFLGYICSDKVYPFIIFAKCIIFVMSKLGMGQRKAFAAVRKSSYFVRPGLSR